MALRTDYKDDILDLTQNTQRKYRMITNADGTVSFEDVTIYSQVGDSFGAFELNQIANVVNEGSGNIDYFPEEDMIKIKDAEGVWHDWASGGLNDNPLIPTMTSNTYPYGIASGYKINASNTEYKAFDGDTQTYCTSTATGTSPYPYVEYTFNKEVKMFKVELWLGHQTKKDSIFLNILVLIDDVWTNIKSTSIAILEGNTPTSFIYDFAPQNIKGIRVELQDHTSSRSQFYGVQVYGKKTV